MAFAACVKGATTVLAPFIAPFITPPPALPFLVGFCVVD